MAIPEGVKEKILRAEKHFIELQSELKTFYKSDPGELVVVPATANEPRKIAYRQRKPMPLRFGLICGDCLQCLRSSLDYLAWELVIAGGKQKPNKQTMFPIKLTQPQFKNEIVKRNRLNGMDTAAIDLIEALQPFNFEHPNKSPLAVLEELTNLNKHRHIIFTDLAGTFTRPAHNIPHIYGIVTWEDNRSIRQQAPVWAYARFQESVVKNMEITIIVDTLVRCVWNLINGQFLRFFS